MPSLRHNQRRLFLGRPEVRGDGAKVLEVFYLKLFPRMRSSKNWSDQHKYITWAAASWTQHMSF